MNSRKILFWTIPLFYLTTHSVVFAQSINTDAILAFDARSLFGKKNQNIDLSVFSIQNYVAPGRYLVSVSVNDQSLGLKDVSFYHIDKQHTSLCIDPQLLKSFDLDPKVLKLLKVQGCIGIKQISADAYYQFDASELKLDISIPQAYIAQRPKGYISPARFDSGVSSSFIRYDYNAYWDQFKRNGDTHKKNQYAQFLNLDAGLNLGQWNYRHQGAFDSRNTSLGQYRSNQNEISRDLVNLRSRLSLGEFINRSVYIESIPMRGIQLYSDIQMLPMSQRSYAPVIESYVQNNALVSIYQNGQKIDERTVAAGIFKIKDLNIISTRGDLTVEIKESGGEKRSFIVPLQSNSNLVRPGQFNYNIALGNYNAYGQTEKQSIGQVSFEYGMNNVMSLYGGASFSEPYQSQLFGIALNTPLGGINVDSELSQFEAFNDNRKGQRLQSSYRYNDPSLNLQLMLNARYQSEDYLRLNNAMTLNRHLNNINTNQSSISSNQELEQQYLDFRQNYLLKQQYSISLNKSFSHNSFGSLNLSLLQSSYWNDPKTYHQMSLSYNNRWKKLSYSLGLSQTENQLSKDQQAYFSLTVPLSFREHTLNSSSYLNYDSQQESVTAFSSLTGVLGEQQQTSFSVGVASNARQKQDTLSVSGNVSHRFPKVMLNSSLSHDESHTQSSISAKGAIVAHAHGLTAVNDLSDTYTIIHADHGQGATVENAWGVKLDRFGNAIYPYSIPYQENQISIDPSNLAFNLNLVENKKIIVPKNHSATFVEFKPQRSSLILLMIKNADQRFSMATAVRNQSDQVIGRISQSNEVIVEDESLLTPNLHIQWGDTAAESCNIVLNAEQMESKANEHGEFNLIEVECN